MALLKDYSYGTKSGNYWKILGLYPDSMHGVTKARIALYSTKEARIKDDASYVLSKDYSLVGITSNRDSAYALLKLNNDFTNCKDV